MKMRLLSALFAFLFPAFLAAQDIPTSDEVRRVMEFYNDGQGQGIVLIDSKVCQEINKEGPEKFNCKNEIIEFVKGSDASAPPEVKHKTKVGESLFIWMAYMVPKGDEENIIVQYNRSGITRRSSNLAVKGSIRYRTWSKFTPRKEGNWEVKILHDTGDAPKELNSFNLIVEK